MAFAALLQNEQYTHRACGMHANVREVLRSVQKGDDPVVAAERIREKWRELPELGDIPMGMIFGTPIGKELLDLTSAEDAVVLCFIMDPMDIDCKQMTFIKSDSFASATAVFEKLYKWDWSVS
eukprot:CAMPEP_0114544840 /NCGR_PEP_ID=MMETSP0114-20121206/3086_1 /TAXON_ID=31324 /ORGANISM="Goniomonas sp, Strain m" /LENGTH=122 /DNA_ID=CAMNT_0001729237 /DNA_START=20 /DNA_END=388 /DNA_ORIENTATION=+